MQAQSQLWQATAPVETYQICSKAHGEFSLIRTSLYMWQILIIPEFNVFFQMIRTEQQWLAVFQLTIVLSYPTCVILDADGFLFIVDNDNNRIVASDSYGFRCLVGCLKTPGNASDQLYYPWILSFDSYGNMFVTDRYNHRVQKFLLATNSCGKHPKLSAEKRLGRQL